MAAGGDFVLALPGTAVPIFEFQLPKGVAGPVRIKVAQQQLVDRAGQAMRALALRPLALGRTNPAAWEKALVVDPQVLGNWCLEVEGEKRCRAVLPDYLTLPAASQALVCDVSGRDISARIGLEDGFTAPVQIAVAQLEAALSQGGIQRAVLGSGVPDAIRDLFRSHEVPVRLLEDEGSETDLKRFAHGELQMDLRRSDQLTSASGGAARMLVAAMALAFLAFAVWTAGIYAEIRGARNAAADLRGQAEMVLRRSLLPDGPIVDIRAQVDLRFAERDAGPDAGDDASSLALMSRATVVLFGKNIDVSEIAQSEEALLITIRTEDFAKAEQIETDLRNADISVSTDGARIRDDGRVEALFRIALSREPAE